MNTISFEKLKQKCVREFCTKNTNSHSTHNGVIAGNIAIAQLVELKNTGKFAKWRELLQTSEDECVKAIEATDIRNVKALSELCPESVPEWIKKGNYLVDLTEQGWIFFKN